MHRGIGDGKGDLGDHPSLLGELDAAPEVAVVVQAAEGTGDVGALLLLNLEHKLPYVSRYGIHPESVEAPLKHMCLDPCLMERGCPSADGYVRILAEQQVDLLESAAVGFDPVEASHIYDCRGDFHELVHAWYVFPRRLPHIPVHEGELYFSCHSP